jgi:hypothetical protein
MSYRKVQDGANGYELNKEAGFWSVAVPEETTNLIKNPGFEGAALPFTNTSSSAGSLATQDTTWRAFGIKSASVSLLNAGNFSFNLANTESIFTALKDYTWSFYYKGTAGKQLLLEVIHSLGSAVLASKTIIASGKVERPSLTFNVPASITTGHTITLKITNPNGSTYVFNVDAYQLEPKSYLTTYIDGDLTGGSWLGLPYNAFSVRAAESAGGRIYDFKRDFNFSVMEFSGAGLPPMEHQTTDQIYLGGKVVQRTQPLERPITLGGVVEGRNYDDLLGLVDKMNQALAPATGSQTQLPLKLKFTPYNGTTLLGQEVEATVLYLGGLEGNVTNLNQMRYALMFEEFVPVGFEGVTEQYSSLNTNTAPFAGNAYIKRPGGEWDKLPRAVTPAAPVTIRLFEDNNKTIYVASGTGTTYRVDKISYNPITKTETIAQSWTGFNGPILAMAVLPDSGDILVGGNFTAPFAYTARLQTGGVTAAFVTLNAAVYAIYVEPAGYVWLGGDFTTTGTRLGVWTQAGTFNTGLTASARVRAIVAGPKTGQAYIGGEFFTIGPGSTSAEKVGLVDFLAPGAPTYAGLNGGLLGGHVFAMAIGPDGSLYAGGAFTTDVNSNPLLRVAKYSAGRWLQVGSGLAGNVTSMDFDVAGNLYAATGNFYKVFDGNFWLPMENMDYGATSLGQLLITSDSRQIVTYDTSPGTHYFAGTTDITNPGSAPAYPKIRIYGPSVSGNGTVTVHKVTNFATGASINLEYAMSYGEILTLDFTRPRNIQVTSNLFGSVKAKLVSNSQLAKFFLVPSRNGSRTNKIVVLADMPPTGPPSLSADITWKNTYQGIEGSVK